MSSIEAVKRRIQAVSSPGHHILAPFLESSPRGKLEFIMDSMGSVLRPQLNKTLQHILAFRLVRITFKDQHSSVRNKAYTSTLCWISS